MLPIILSEIHLETETPPDILNRNVFNSEKWVLNIMERL